MRLVRATCLSKSDEGRLKLLYRDAFNEKVKKLTKRSTVTVSLSKLICAHVIQNEKASQRIIYYIENLGN